MRAHLFLAFIGAFLAVASTAAQTGEWFVVPAVPEGKGFTCVASPSPSHFVAVGGFGRIARSTDGGITWAAVASGLPFEGTSNLDDLSFGSELTGTAIGLTGNILHTTDGGTNWYRGYIGVEGYVGSVFFLDENFGVVTNAFLMKTRNGGKGWERQIFTVEGFVQDIVLLDTLRAVAVGPAGFAGSGTIFTTDDGGATWDYGVVEGLGMRQLYSITFADREHGLISGGGGAVLRTEDGGANWTLVETGVQVDLMGVAMRDPMNGIVVGQEGTILRTTDGGVTWRREASPTFASLAGVRFDRDGTAIIVGGEETGIILRYQKVPSGVEEAEERDGPESLLLSPNPATGQVRIEWRCGSKTAARGEKRGEPGEIIICDLLGRDVARFAAQSDVGSVLWNAEQVPSGVYIVVLTNGERWETRRIVVGR